MRRGAAKEEQKTESRCDPPCEKAGWQVAQKSSEQKLQITCTARGIMKLKRPNVWGFGRRLCSRTAASSFNNMSYNVQAVPSRVVPASKHETLKQ